jgi:hypothetical protein
MEVDSGSAIPFLDVLVIRKEMTLGIKVSENPPTLADISASALIILHVKRDLIQPSQMSFHHKTRTRFVQ